MWNSWHIVGMQLMVVYAYHKEKKNWKKPLKISYLFYLNQYFLRVNPETIASIYLTENSWWIENEVYNILKSKCYNVVLPSQQEVVIPEIYRWVYATCCK